MNDEISRAQDQLGRALEEARAGEDRALAQQVREVGEHFVRMLNALLRLTRLHHPDNHAFDQPVVEVERSMARLYDLLGPLRVLCVEGQVYVNDVRIRFDERVTVITELAEDLARHGCGGLLFQTPIPDALIRRIIPIIAAERAAEEPRLKFQEALNDGGLQSILALGFFRLRMGGELAPKGEGPTVQTSIKRANGLVQSAWENLAAGRVPNPLPLRRVVNELVDAAGDTDLLAAEEDAPELGANEYADHCRRVTVICILIAKELGLPAAGIADLGVAAMFHDMGYAARHDGQPPGFEDHPLEGLRILLRQRGFHAAKVRRLLTSMEHHLPAVGGSAQPVLYARIVHIADDFDTLTRPREGRPLCSPAVAIRRMAGASGTLYDPILFQLMVNRLGKYPPGTALRLADGRVVVSTSGVRTPETFDTPMCRVVIEADGSQPKRMYPLDLASEGEVVGEVEL